ncbi:SIR2 family protein [Hyalangium rubrum]|uniref:SIR2 family protein n=1 Tax=Hyalangium rubrum TaxID=3103134 RepID=A0ABU5H277_9BACT|nr:SIR2 family protein [Hyalangium sp. s54d21]MDY7227558.1 SIR2 family protein [Hyalangium sp. s54d21]
MVDRYPYMTPKPPGLLVRYIQQGRCVVFVGAGLSSAAGLPTWRKLLLEVVDDMVAALPEGETHQAELQRLVEQGKLLEVADFCKEELGAAYHQFLTDKLRGDKEALPAVHQTLMQLPFSAWVTTNYDKLLERAYAAEKGAYPKTLTHKDTEALGGLLFNGGPFILKAHGDIDRPETVVLTSRDYSEIIHANPAFNEVFTGLLLTKALFFVGYSLSDPDFRLLMDRQLTHFRGYVPERYALMTDLGPVERDVLWRTARIRVIPYTSGKHEEVPLFLRALKDAVTPKPVAVESPAQMKVVPQNMAAPVAPPIPAPHPSDSRVPARAPSPVPQSPGGLLSRLLEPLGVSHPSEESTEDEATLSAGPVPQAAPAVPQPAATRTAASIEPQHLFLESAEGRLQLRLIQGKPESTVQGVAPSALTEDLWLSLKRALEEGAKSHAWLYTHVPKLFAKYLPGPVLEALGAPSVSPQAPLVLHGAPELARFPWELLPLRDAPVALARKVVRAPVGVARQARGTPRVRSSPRVLLIEGGGSTSGGARQEIDALARLYGRSLGISCTVLRGEDAMFNRVMAELDRELPDLLHYTGGVGQVDGELYLELPGAMELSSGALRSVLDRGQLPFLVVNAPSSAFVPHAFGVHAGARGYQRLPVPNSRVSLFEGREGFMDLATQVGVGAFVGAFDMPSAEAGTAFMAALHRDLLLRLPIADAVRRARVETLQKFPEDPTARQYVLSGDGALSFPAAGDDEG